MKKKTSIIMPILWTFMACLWVVMSFSWYFLLRDFYLNPTTERELVLRGVTALLAVIKAVVSWTRYAKDKKISEEENLNV